MKLTGYYLILQGILALTYQSLRQSAENKPTAPPKKKNHLVLPILTGAAVGTGVAILVAKGCKKSACQHHAG